MIKFLRDHPALFISSRKILVIADLHIGIEHELYEKGIIIPPQAEKFQKIIEKLIAITKAKSLIVLGDIKHEVPGLSFREEREIPKLFKSLTKKVKIICCKGNHDTYLEKILPREVKIFSSKGFKIGEYGFFHGHAWPSKKLMQCNYLLMGHVHPVVQLEDKFGYSIIEQVWVRGEIFKDKIKKKYGIKKTGRLELIIFPAFNRLLGGTFVNVKSASSELLGPLLRNDFVDMENAELYFLNGINLGKISSLINYFPII
jgi:putative SbcD/Mre11-related phosphoesterase